MTLPCSLARAGNYAANNPRTRASLPCFNYYETAASIASNDAPYER